MLLIGVRIFKGFGAAKHAFYGPLFCDYPIDFSKPPALELPRMVIRRSSANRPSENAGAVGHGRDIGMLATDEALA